MHPLTLHNSCELGQIRGLSARIEPTAAGCEAEFRLKGAIAAIIVPGAKPPARTDFLWKTTCFEVFWQPVGGSSYREFNLSPSSQWAAYDFDDVRQNGRDGAVDAIAIACSHTDNELALRASIAADLPDPARVGLSAVIECADGALQFWALAFAPGKPDFHQEACRTMAVERIVEQES